MRIETAQKGHGLDADTLYLRPDEKFREGERLYVVSAEEFDAYRKAVTELAQLANSVIDKYYHPQVTGLVATALELKGPTP